MRLLSTCLVYILSYTMLCAFKPSHYYLLRTDKRLLTLHTGGRARHSSSPSATGFLFSSLALSGASLENLSAGQPFLRNQSCDAHIVVSDVIRTLRFCSFLPIACIDDNQSRVPKKGQTVKR
jgi:hypothetical protein